MRDPQIEQIAQRFADGYDTLELPDERDKAKRLFAEQVGQRRNEISSYEVLLRTGEMIGEDMTIFLNQQPRIDPLSRDQAIAQVEEAKKGVPWYRQALGKAVGAAQWWQENVTEPTAATAIGVAATILPGEQGFDRRMDEARRRIAAEGGLDRKSNKLTDFVEAATAAYHETDTVWGLKGALELVVDPLNLIGLGIPGRAMKALPALRPLLFPLHAIDRAPDVIVRKVISGGANIAGEVTGLKQLKAPHITTQVKDVERQVGATISGAFGPSKIAGGVAKDSADLFSNLSRFPEDATPFSLRNVMNHIAEEFADSPAGVAGWEKFHDKIQNLAPSEATAFLSSFAADLERKALIHGGKKFTGEVVEGTVRQRRVKAVSGVLEKLSFDETTARGIGEAVDDKIYTIWDSLWLKKLEPMIVRPWAVAHLAFAGFFVMNIVEDIAVATVGMGGLGRRGLNDKEFRWLTAGLNDVPTDLFNAEAQQRLLMDTGPNFYNTPVEDGAIKSIAKKLVLWPLTASSKVGWAIRRSAWTNRYYKEFDRALRESGISSQEIDGLRDFIHAELPQGMEHLRDEIGAKVWTAVTTGDTQVIRDLRETLTSNRIIQKSQMEVISQYPELPTDVRRALQQVVQQDSINPNNVDQLMDKARESLLEWHKFSSAAIQDRYSDLIQGLTQRPPKSAAEATGLLTMFQHVMDDLAQLPREINAHARVRAAATSPKNRSAIWDEAFGVIDKDIGNARKQVEEALVKGRPDIERLLVDQARTPAQQQAVRRSIDDIFSGYTDISENLRETWTNYRARKGELFDGTPADERGDWFWLQLDSIGSETWSAEYEFRSGASNRIREGWNALFDTLPSDISGKDREFVRRGLESSVNDAEDQLNRLRVALEDTEAALLRDPEALASKHQQRISGLSDNIAVAVRQRNEMVTKLEKFSAVRPRNTSPEALRTYDRNIRLTTNSLDEARQNGLDDLIPEIQNDLDDLIKEREGVFENFIPTLLKPEWETLKAERVRLAQLVSTETTEVGQQSLRGQVGRNNANINRFRQRVERGEAAQEVERVAGITQRSMTETAQTIIQGGGAPETVDDMVRRLDELAASGDPAATSFNESLETARTTFAEPDIIAEIEAQPVIFRNKKLTRANATTILDRAVQEGGSTTNLVGEDAFAKAATGDTGRYFVGAFPDRTVTLPLPEATADTIQEFAAANLELLRKRNHYIGTWVDGDNLVINVSVSLEDRNNAMKLASLKDQEAIFDAVSSEALETETIGTPFMSGREQVYDELYSRIVALNEVPRLDPVQLDVLRQATTNDLTPTGTLAALVNDGFLEAPVRLRGGKWRTKLTDSGQDALSVRAPDRNINSLVDDLPPPIRELDTVIETQMKSVQTIMDDSLRLWENPPLRADQESVVGSYLDRVSGYMGQRSELTTQLKASRSVASKRTTEEYNRWFINYDNRTTMDFVMQRFMPFWMYESRRWPRLISLAAKRPVLAKHLTLAGGDWDYGYSPTPYGFEFNPLKGTAAGSVRRSLARDFPELHSGYRGRVEQGFDWFARGAFYFNPLITSSASLLQGEPAAITPPPVSLVLHGMAAAGVNLPSPLRQLAFDSRYTNFLIDQVIADKFELNPTEIRNLAKNGDEQAISQLYLAEKEAAARMIAINQSSVIRYRPEAKREFTESTNEAVERIVGIPKDVMESAQRLGLTYYEITAVSGPQHRAIRDAVPGFDAWIGASIALRPVEEQKIQRKINAFWSAIEVGREENKTSRQQLSNRWLSGNISGPSALDELSSLNRERGAIFNSLHALPEFIDVPISLEDRLAYISKFGKPSPQVSPIDEALEQYYAISSDDFIDKRTGDIDWGAFFDQRKAVLDGYDEPIRSIMDSEIRRTETELERSLDVHSPLMREYFGIRSAVMDQIAQADPITAEAYAEYRRLMNFIQKSTPAEAQYLERQARAILASNPQLSMAEAIVRQTRQRLRRENPDMEKVYQLFIARPGSVPTPFVPRRRRVRTSGFGTIAPFPKFQ